MHFTDRKHTNSESDFDRGIKIRELHELGNGQEKIERLSLTARSVTLYRRVRCITVALDMFLCFYINIYKPL